MVVAVVVDYMLVELRPVAVVLVAVVMVVMVAVLLQMEQ
jgi:hypothetical protein